MKKIEKAMLIIASVIMFAIFSIAAASLIGGSTMEIDSVMFYPAEVAWVSSADVEVAVQLPRTYGIPTGIFSYQYEDYGTAGKAAAAQAAGEGVYTTPSANYQVADMTAGTISVYRGDLDGADSTALQTSVVTEIWFYWIPSDLTW